LAIDDLIPSVVDAGMRMSTIHNAIILNVEPTELKLAIHLVGMLLMHPWMSMIRVVSKKVCQFVGT